MSNLLATIHHSAQALDVYQRVLGVTQNNVANASTPGYVKQAVQLQALAFDASRGSLGGVWAGEIQSARNEYAEAAVRRRVTELGEQSQAVDSLSSLEGLVDVSGNTGVGAALNSFYQSLSNWSLSANSTTARQEVLDAAEAVASSFRQAAATVDRAARDAENQLRDTVQRINDLTGELQKLNVEARKGGRGDAGLDANIHAALEDLAQYIDITVTQQEDGSVTVLAGGQTPLLIGENRYELSFSLVGAANGASLASIQSASGADVTGQLTSGKIGALLDFRNRVVPGMIGGPAETGDLNRLAQTVADRVNEVLTSGRLSDGPPPVAGIALFTYDNTSAIGVAGSLAIDTALAASDLAAIDPGPPYVSNGIPLRLSALATPETPADKIDGLSYAEFFGRIGTRIGQDLNNAETAQQTAQSLVAQAKDLRQQTSGVSLDEEAVILLEFQRGYQAMSQFIKALDEMTQTVLGMLN
jgi:flagellar hook-associated protein 1 FlgK